MMKLKKPRRELTPNEKANADRLKSIFLKRQTETGITQVKLAEMNGISQSAVGQYLNGEIPLNLPSMIMFAISLKCRIQDIDPNCPHQMLTTPEEKALVAAYWDMSNRNDPAGKKALLQVAELSPAYRVTLERTPEIETSAPDSSTDKQ